MRQAIHPSDATEDSVRTAAAKVGAVEADLAVERLKLHGQLSPILTPEQREKMATIEAHISDFATDAMSRMHE